MNTCFFSKHRAAVWQKGGLFSIRSLYGICLLQKVSLYEGNSGSNVRGQIQMSGGNWLGKAHPSNSTPSVAPPPLRPEISQP